MLNKWIFLILSNVLAWALGIHIATSPREFHNSAWIICIMSLVAGASATYYAVMCADEQRIKRIESYLRAKNDHLPRLPEQNP